MSIDFNADEIFQLGIQIEMNGKQFYETVAKNTLDLSERPLFRAFEMGLEEMGV